MEWTALVWIALAISMIFNMARGGGCCGGHGAPPSNESKKRVDQ